MTNAITVNDIGLNYRAPQRHSIKSFRFFNPSNKKETIRALDNVSFTVQDGEILGLIGSNGSGKSTLLKVMAGVLTPDSGSINLNGRSVSLLSLGLGFNTDLSGHDNIYLSGLLLGFSEEDIDMLYQDIVDFSELGDAIFQPVKTYSSGMYSKLAFSIAVTLRTDILLIDEVLSVGDILFRKKSHSRMESLIRDKNRTVIIVSHNLSEIRQLCDRVVWLEKGKIKAVGPTDEILDAYQKEFAFNPNSINWLEVPVIKLTPDKNTIRVSWQNIPNAIDYRIYRKELSPLSHWKPIEDGFTKNEYIDTPPSKSKYYLYTVRARATNSRGSIWSEFKPSVPMKLL